MTGPDAFPAFTGPQGPKGDTGVPGAPQLVTQPQRLTPSYPLLLSTTNTPTLIPGMTWSYTAAGGENVDIIAQGTPSSTSGSSPSAFIWIAHLKPDTTTEYLGIAGLLSTSNGFHVQGHALSLAAGSHTFSLLWTLSGSLTPAFSFDPTVLLNGLPRASFAFKIEVRASTA